MQPKIKFIKDDDEIILTYGKATPYIPFKNFK